MAGKKQPDLERHIRKSREPNLRAGRKNFLEMRFMKPS